MRYRLEDIVAFMTVVETGGVSAAAGRLGLAKSVVSRRVADLETALSAVLLHRSTQGTVPTDAGAAFYERARAALADLEDAADTAAERGGVLRGSLRVAAPVSFGALHLGPLLFDFLQQHPALDLVLELDDRYVDIAGEGYDLAVRIGRLGDSSLRSRRLTTSRRVLCCSPGYAAAAGLPRSLDDLRTHACIGYAQASAGNVWTFAPERPGGEPRTVVVKGRLAANNGEVMRDAAIRGMGLTVLPTFLVADALRDGRLIQVLPDQPPLPDAVHAVYAPSRRLSPRVRALIDHLADACADPPPWERGLPE